jgi:hypothetical protein
MEICRFVAKRVLLFSVNYKMEEAQVRKLLMSLLSVYRRHVSHIYQLKFVRKQQAATDKSLPRYRFKTTDAENSTYQSSLRMALYVCASEVYEVMSSLLSAELCTWKRQLFT